MTSVDKKNGTEKSELPFPHEIKHVDPETTKQLLKDFKGERTGFIQIGPKNYFFQSTFEEDIKVIYNFQFRPDDVVLLGFPRSGTTLIEEMTWLICNDFDYEKAAQAHLFRRFQQLEMSSMIHKEVKEELYTNNESDPVKINLVERVVTPSWSKLEEMTERRFLRAHIPISLLSPDLLKTGCKILYIARNPKDVAVSYYFYNRLVNLSGYTGDLKTFWNYFENGLLNWTPYFENVKEGWDRRNDENVLFMFYEDITKDLKATIEKVAKFFGKPYTEENVNRLADHLKIDNFKKNKTVNLDMYSYLGLLKDNEEGFIRKGQSGGWKNYFDEELTKRADAWMEKNLKDTDLRFPEV